jgi:excisionase family DNA binding protein
MDRVTVQEAAQRLGISQDAVRQRVRRGSMRHDKDDKGRVYVYLNPTNTRPTIVHDTSRDTVHDASPNELLKELRERIHFLETELGDRKEESRRKDHIIAALTQRIPELEPASERREYSQRPTEHVDRGTIDRGTTDRGSTTRISTTESRRPRWAFLLRELVSASRRVRRGVRRG